LKSGPPQTPGSSGGFEVKSGGSYFFNRERPGAVEFRTPLASGAIRGTELHLRVAENGRTEVALLDGAVDLTNEFGALSLVTGDQAVVEPGQAPRKTPSIEAINIIQWVLYYPGVLDVDELGLTDAEKTALATSIAAYRSGDLLQAQASYPENRQPASNEEKIYRAATLLSAGQAGQADALLGNIASPLADALREIIATVKKQEWKRSAAPVLATEWMAESYYLQSQSKLPEALRAARNAAAKSPAFGFAWVRVAELEFSFGHTDDALGALKTGLELSPRNAQGVALRGFLQAAQKKFEQAEESFSEAIALDGGLGMRGWVVAS
jgi:tetratricopeptide (TPR) repeat protein